MPSRVAQLSALHTEIFTCTLCALHENRTRTVPGSGDPDAEIMFIGEAPGQREDELGLPFVGRSGQYLEDLLAEIGLARNDVFIANIVKCRPPKNRDPQPDEIAACNAYLVAQINIIDPLMIVTVGRHSMNMFFPNERISRIHGQPKYGVRCLYYPIYHPAYVLRNRDKLHPEMAADMARIPELLAEMRERRASGAIPDPAEEAPDDEESPAAETSPAEETSTNDETSSDGDSPRQMGLFD